jgi:hypothetical protein
MDPCASSCLVSNSLLSSAVFPKIVLPVSLSYEVKEDVKDNLVLSDFEQVPSFDFVNNTKEYKKFSSVKKNFVGDKYLRARNYANPFERIGYSIFTNRAGVKLANIDRVFNLGNEIFTLLHPKSNRQLTFCDVAAGPGAFTQYMQYRYPLSKGYGMTLKSGLDWDLRYIDTSRFFITYGESSEGNLYYDWPSFRQFVLERNDGEGVDVVLGDGGFDFEISDSITSLDDQEYINSRLLTSQIVVAMTIGKVGSDAVIKCFDTVTKYSADLLYLLCSCYDDVYIFKPCTSRPTNTEKYIVCKNLHDDILPQQKLIIELVSSYTDDSSGIKPFATGIQSFYSSLPSSFVSALSDLNTKFLQASMKSASSIVRVMSDENVEDPALDYELNKFLTIFVLPETPRNSKNTVLSV